MIVKIYNGIIKNPGNQKIRKLKHSKLLEKWGAEVMNAALTLFQVAGFNQTNEHGITFLSFNNEDLTILEIVHASLNERVIQEEEEIQAKRAEISAKNKNKSSAGDTAAAKRKKAIKDKLALDKKEFEAERKANPIQSSKASKIKFGRKTVAVEFDTSGPSGG